MGAPSPAMMVNAAKEADSADARARLWVGLGILLLVHILPWRGAVTMVVSWVVSLAIAWGVLHEAGGMASLEAERRFAVRWAVQLLMLPLAIGIAGIILRSPRLAEAAGGALAAPGLPALGVLVAALARRRAP